MKRGLVIGKFLPVHLGHLALIRFAAAQCDELIVSMSFRSDDPIDHSLRYRWLCDILKNDESIKVYEIVDDFDHEELPLAERTKEWATVIRNVYPPIHVLFSSEAYGDAFALNLGAQHILFDQQRVGVPIAASLIRKNPLQYWNFIPEVVRPYFVKKICLYGPESTGKSTLTIALAAEFDTAFVPEVAREMLITNDFTIQDIIAIGLAHAERIHRMEKVANKILFCDTDIITTQIYSQYYLNIIPEVLYSLEKETRYDHYFLMDIDVPWVADGLRDLGHKRDEMFAIFKQALERRGVTYTIVRGDFQERLEQMKNWVTKHLHVQPVR
jgi:HTH-type transcriptional regulator, transcriptional repressor of NAD biosynthesis genes